MEVTLEGSNSAETPPPWDGVARGHRLVTGNGAVGGTTTFFFFFIYLIHLEFAWGVEFVYKWCSLLTHSLLWFAT